MLLVPGQDFVEGSISNLVSVVLAVSIDLAQREVFQHRSMREFGRAAP